MSGIENAGGFLTAVVTKTSNYTLTSSDHVVRIDATSGNRVITFPLAGSHIGREYILKRIDSNTSNTVTFTFGGMDGLDGGPSSLLCGDVMHVVSELSAVWGCTSLQNDDIVVLDTAAYNVFDSDTSIITGDGVVGIVVPASWDGCNLVDVVAAVDTQGGTSGTTDIQLRRRRAGSENDMLSGKVTISYNEYYASDGTINASYDDLQEGDVIYVDVDAIPSGGTPTGLFVTLTIGR